LSCGEATERSITAMAAKIDSSARNVNQLANLFPIGAASRQA
jgi:hypothetical protein